MKQIISLLLILLMVSISSNLTAQQADRKPSEQKERVQQGTKDRAEAKTEGTQSTQSEVQREQQKERVQGDKGRPSGKGEGVQQSKEHPGKGHAYGKDKGELEGKEFGQQRAAEARSRQGALDEAEANIGRSEASNASSREKLKKARAKLDEKMANKEITKEEYEQKKKALDGLEASLQRIERENQAAREKLNKERAKEK